MTAAKPTRRSRHSTTPPAVHCLCHGDAHIGNTYVEPGGRDEAWADYVQHQLHGLIWANVPPIMQSPANVLAMAEHYTTAIIDNNTLRAVGV